LVLSVDPRPYYIPKNFVPLGWIIDTAAVLASRFREKEVDVQVDWGTEN